MPTSPELVCNTLRTLQPHLLRVFLCTGPVHPGGDLPRCPSLRSRETTAGAAAEEAIQAVVFEISTRNRFLPLYKMEHDTVIVGDSIVRHVLAIIAEGKVHTHRFPGACVLDVSAQIPAILKATRALDGSCCTRG